MNTTLNVFLNQGNLWSRVLSLAPDTVKNIATADKLKVSSIFKHGNKTVFDKVLLLSDEELASDIVLTHGDKWNSLITAELDKLDITMLDGRMTKEVITHNNTKTGSVDNENKVKVVPVEVRAISGGKFFVVDKGLNVGDKVLLEGVGIITEGTAIKPELVDFNEVLNPTTK